MKRYKSRRRSKRKPYRKSYRKSKRRLNRKLNRKSKRRLIGGAIAEKIAARKRAEKEAAEREAADIARELAGREARLDGDIETLKKRIAKLKGEEYVACPEPEPEPELVPSQPQQSREESRAFVAARRHRLRLHEAQREAELKQAGGELQRLIDEKRRKIEEQRRKERIADRIAAAEERARQRSCAAQRSAATRAARAAQLQRLAGEYGLPPQPSIYTGSGDLARAGPPIGHELFCPGWLSEPEPVTMPYTSTLQPVKMPQPEPEPEPEPQRRAIHINDIPEARYLDKAGKIALAKRLINDKIYTFILME